MGNTELALDPRFDDAYSRWRHQDELDAIVQEWTRQQNHWEALHLLQQHGVTAGVVLDEAEVMADPPLG